MKTRSFFGHFKLHRFKHHPIAIPVVTFLFLFFISLIGFISMNGETLTPTDSHIVRLSIDGQQRTVPTRATTVGDLMKRLNITLKQQDVVTPAVDAQITDDNFAITVARARQVVVIDNGQKKITYSAQATPREVAKDAGITTYPEDKVDSSTAPIEPTEALSTGVPVEQIVIDRAKTANLNLYGTAVTVRTRATTVGDVLKEKNVKLEQGDNVQPEVSTPLAPTTQIFVVRKGKQVQTTEEVIASPVQRVDDYNLTLGSTRVQDAGKPGKKLVTYEIELTNQKESGRKVIQEIVIEEPTTRVIAVGKKAPVVAGNKAELMAAAGISPDEYYAVDYIISHESGWRLNARNSSGCLGLGQACPGSKLINACPAWESDGVCQLIFFSGYARGRYGSWSGAYQFWLSQHWW
jgi:resuscitation-promoting factor RpfB